MNLSSKILNDHNLYKNLTVDDLKLLFFVSVGIIAAVLTLVKGIWGLMVIIVGIFIAFKTLNHIRGKYRRKYLRSMLRIWILGDFVYEKRTVKDKKRQRSKFLGSFK